MRTHKLTCFAGAVAVIGVLAAGAPALAAPVPSSAAMLLSSTVVSPVTQARWWGPRWGWRGRYWRGPRWYWRGPVAGAVIGGVIVSRAYRGPVYYGPPGGPDWLAYCSARYRSFDPRTGTFMGYDGHRHPCR